MKIREFTYQKKSGDVKNYEVLILNSEPTYLEGIALNYLTADEKIKLQAIVEAYELQMREFGKSFRRFNKESIKD